jgi:hypothetical protein
MTEADWLTGTNPTEMLDFLRGSGTASDRKLRLFGVACSRRVWGQLHGLARAAVEVAERFADGWAGPEALRAARLACQSAGGSAAWYAAASSPAVAARNAALSASHLPGEPEAQAALLREIFGNPFRPPPPLAPDVLGWNGGSVVRLAQAAYDDRLLPEGTLIPARLVALADALEEAGCADGGLLAHLRGPGPHVRGCWSLDPLLLAGR